MPGETWAVVVAAGHGARFGAPMNKVYLPLCGKRVLQWTLGSLARADVLDGMVLVHAPGEEALAREAAADIALPVAYAQGGSTRAVSVLEGLRALPAACEIVLVHDGARPFPGGELIRQCAKSVREHGSGVAAREMTDTIKRAEDGIAQGTLPRQELVAVQTPQAFRREELLWAYESVSLEDATDDAEVYARAGGEVHLVLSRQENRKITTGEDLALMEALLRGSSLPRVGTGYDVHRLTPGRKLILCGVDIPHDVGLDGHSDADVATHALIDALLGACALGDIGQLFPDTDAQYKGADSIDLLRQTVRHMAEEGFIPTQTDITIMAQQPKLAPYRDAMRQRLCEALGLSLEAVSVKATTTEGLGFAGRQEGIAAQAAATVTRVDWPEV